MKTSHVSLFTALLLAAAAPLWAGGVTPSATQGGVSWQLNTANSGGTLRVSAPDGSVFEKQFASGENPSYVSPRGVLPDGQYVYEVSLAPILSAEQRAQAQDARAQGDKPSALPAGSRESGSFRVAGGAIKLADASAVESGNNPSVPQDTFTDVIIQGFTPRLLFDDTSTATGTSMTDWELEANTGTTDEFSIKDLTAGTNPFTILGAAPNNSLYIAANGNVGLGTSVPAQDLHISGLFATSIRMQSSLIFGGTQTWDLNTGSSGFFFQDITAGTTPFVIRNGTGFIGMGTSNPAGKLHVFSPGNQLSIFQSSDNMAVQFRLQTDSTNRRFVALNAAGTQQSQLLFGDNGAFDFLGPTAADVRMRLLANGNVGIGTTAPDQKLTVNGNASKTTGGSWLAFSDERLKDIKGEYSAGLKALLQLHPIRYEYKKDNAIGLVSEGEHIGFGAAAVQKVIPEAVTKTANGYLMVDNDPILWTMLNAIKEQNAEINQLKEQNKEIAELKAQLKRLQAEVVLNAENRTPERKKVAKSSR